MNINEKRKILKDPHLSEQDVALWKLDEPGDQLNELMDEVQSPRWLEEQIDAVATKAVDSCTEMDEWVFSNWKDEFDWTEATTKEQMRKDLIDDLSYSLLGRFEQILHLVKAGDGEAADAIDPNLAEIAYKYIRK